MPIFNERFNLSAGCVRSPDCAPGSGATCG